MAKQKAKVLMVPGYLGSGPGHWQSRWSRNHSRFGRVQVEDWSAPRREAWVEALAREVEATPGPLVLAAHGLGCLTVAHYAPRAPERIGAALLVAPPDVDRDGIFPRIEGFDPAPEAPLPFRSVLIASENDPLCDPARSRELAQAWGAEFFSMGEAGHINEEAGFGPWPEGLMQLARLIKLAA